MMEPSTPLTYRHSVHLVMVHSTQSTNTTNHSRQMKQIIYTDLFFMQIKKFIILWPI